MLSPRRLVLGTIVVLLVLMLTVAMIGLWLREPLLAASRMFVDEFGGVGVALGFYIPDAFTLPLPNDVAAVLGLAGGLSFLEVVLWGTGGSLVGGATGYWIGRYLRTTPFVARMLSRRDGAVQGVIERYGVLAVAVAAVSPLPYSIFCWAAGAGRLPFKHFMLVSQLRWLRVAGYLYLIKLGLFNVLG